MPVTPPRKKWKKKRGDTPFPRRVTFQGGVERGDGEGGRSKSEGSQGSQKEAPSVPSGDDTDKEKDKDRLKKKLLEKKAAVKAPLLALGPPKPKGDSQQGRKIVLKQRPKN